MDLAWQQSETKAMCLYWKTVLDFQLHTLILLRSATQDFNFELYIASLHSLIIWFLALDNHNYFYSPLPPPQMYLEASTKATGLGQVHEQNNVVIKYPVIKGIEGVNHLLNKKDKSALLRQ